MIKQFDLTLSCTTSLGWSVAGSNGNTQQSYSPRASLLHAVTSHTLGFICLCFPPQDLIQGQ